MTIKMVATAKMLHTGHKKDQIPPLNSLAIPYKTEILLSLFVDVL